MKLWLKPGKMESPLFAYEPSGDDSNWQYIEARCVWASS
ncbi:DUF3103 domain-containing protein [Vibrio chagasii]|nr:DUF3103 domain-containing protein [Vibrio chagasii]